MKLNTPSSKKGPGSISTEKKIITLILQNTPCPLPPPSLTANAPEKLLKKRHRKFPVFPCHRFSGADWLNFGGVIVYGKKTNHLKIIL